MRMPTIGLLPLVIYPGLRARLPRMGLSVFLVTRNILIRQDRPRVLCPSFGVCAGCLDMRSGPII